MNLTRAEKEQLENAGIQCIQVSKDNNINIYNEIKKINNLIEIYTNQVQQQYIEHLENLNRQERSEDFYPCIVSNKKEMFDFKNDTDIHPAEAEYLISKGWNPELF